MYCEKLHLFLFLSPSLSSLSSSNVYPSPPPFSLLFCIFISHHFSLFSAHSCAFLLLLLSVKWKISPRSLFAFFYHIHRLTPNMHAALVIVVSISYSHITRALALLHRLCTVVVDSLMPWLRHTMEEKMYENEENDNNNSSSSTLRKNNARNKKHKNKSKRHDGSGYEESRDLS